VTIKEDIKLIKRGNDKEKKKLKKNKTTTIEFKGKF
jgi:hypothetical protein